VVPVCTCFTLDAVVTYVSEKRRQNSSPALWMTSWERGAEVQARSDSSSASHRLSPRRLGLKSGEMDLGVVHDLGEKEVVEQGFTETLVGEAELLAGSGRNLLPWALPSSHVSPEALSFLSAGFEGTTSCRQLSVLTRLGPCWTRL